MTAHEHCPDVRCPCAERCEGLLKGERFKRRGNATAGYLLWLFLPLAVILLVVRQVDVLTAVRILVAGVGGWFLVVTVVAIVGALLGADDFIEAVHEEFGEDAES